MTNQPVMDDVELEHVAARASELGDTETEALCDAALAGSSDPRLVHDVVESDARYHGWMERARVTGHATRPTDTRSDSERLRSLFEAARAMPTDVIIWERDVPMAPAELRTWAASNDLKVDERGGGPKDGYKVVSVALRHPGIPVARCIDIYLK